MDPTRLDDVLDAAGADGYLLDASQADANQLYLSGFTGPDPFLTLYAGGEVSMLVSGLEYGRATTEAAADVVERHADYDYEYGGSDARYDMYAAFVRDKDVESVLVPPRGPVGTADALRDRGIDVMVDDGDALTEVRAVKTDDEIAAIRETQRANEAALRAAEALIAGAAVAGEDVPVDDVDAPGPEPVDAGTLVHDGAPLTSERVKREIEVTLLDHGCALDETIVAGGAQAADPHNRGSGPLSANEAIIIDVFPRSKATKYNADMTRTFCVGEPSDTLREWYDLTEEALAAALDAVEPGTTGEEVHAAACAVYEAAGEPTFRTDPETETGFIHSTGHGIGLDVHELPRLSNGGAELEPGHVVTVEPGLYDPDVGGVRLEDLVVVTEDGHENLTDYPLEFVVE
ncbi:M24 family metallopeptidase [Halorubrum sp. JWXQ-INN 858]|uniref:M24 family metallopeptidase n=1 Tax=Halorubrum sp. JWXQ-INN 858 TaxID=2690782 RepID=UPI0013581958|nr:Xaa-Pro peptidase family protein [Halorubrum sp. JWXQ-INN 858]MWV65788.1 M24 family metallopeptidase [Halorubrum sp. JWXQ-INN 858]